MPTGNSLSGNLGHICTFLYFIAGVLIHYKVEVKQRHCNVKVIPSCNIVSRRIQEPLGVVETNINTE